MYPLQKKIFVDVKQIRPQLTQIQQVVTSPNIFHVEKVVTTSTISQVENLAAPKISQVQSVISSPTISQVKMTEPPSENFKITESYVSVSESKRLPDISTSQIRASKVLPLAVLPNIKREYKVLPVKVLPPIDISNNKITGIVSVPQQEEANNNKSQVHSSKASGELLLSNKSSIRANNSLYSSK